MTQQLYAVTRKFDEDDEALILEIFSHEGLAMTHAAKLRVASTGYEVVYDVKTLVPDAATNQEVCFYASIVMDLNELTTPVQLNPDEAQPSNVVEVLPAPLVDVDTYSETVELGEYGWTPVEATARLRSLIEDFIARNQSRIEAAQAQLLQQKQAAAAARKTSLQVHTNYDPDTFDALPW
jgi:hypothetical protein